MSGSVNVFTARGTDQTGPAFASVQNNLKKTRRESEKLNGSLRMMRGGFGQLGHQVQDVAVQLQMGQNPLMVLTQQGSQVASLFGPTGAIIGAVGAVAGALAGAFVPQLLKSDAATGHLEATVGSLSSLFETDAKTGITEYSGALKELSLVSESAAQNLIMMAQIAAMQDMKGFRSEIQDLAEDIEDIDFAARIGGDASQLANAAEDLGLTTTQFVMLTNAAKMVGTEFDKDNEKFAALLNSLMPEKIEDVNDEFLELARRFFAAQGGMAILNQEMETFKGANMPGAVSDTVTEFDRLIERIERLNDRTNKLSPAEQLARQIKDNKKLTREQKRQALERLQAIELVRMQDDAVKSLTKAREKDEKAEEKARRQREREMLRDVGVEIKDNKAADADRKKTEQKLENMRIGFLSELELIGEQEQQKKDFITGLDETFFDAAFTRQDALTLIEQDAAAKRIKIAEDEENQKRRIQQMGMDVITQSLSFMASNLKEGTALQKAAFLASKAFAASEAIIAANRAAALVLPNIPLSKLILGMGYANAAMIMGQAVASFEGGGFTGRGARSGGMDGKGGFAAILHPNESVIDHTKGQGQGVTIVNNIDARGADSSVDIKIRKAVQESSAATIETIRDLSRRRRFV
jgi:hypothetical protein